MLEDAHNEIQAVPAWVNQNAAGLECNSSSRQPVLRFVLLQLLIAMLGPVAAKGAEAQLTLAMASIDVSPAKSHHFPRVPEFSHYVQPTPVMVERIEGPDRNLGNDTVHFPAGVTLTLEAPEREAANPLAWTRRNADDTARGGFFRTATLEAGFGQVFYDKNATIYGHNGTAWEEPGCGYLKLCFRF